MEKKIKQVLINNMELFDENTGLMGIPDEDAKLEIIAQEIVKLFAIPCVSKSLPDHYAGELNTERIKAYSLLHEQYNLEEGTVRDIFCKGADWYKEQCQKDNVC